MTDTPHILVIDDEESICFAFERYFTSRGFAVRTASSVRQGFDCYRERRPDVAFLDVRLPDGSGLDLLEKLRAEDPAATVIVMTAHGSLETVTRAIRGKAFDYLVKPLDLDRAAELVHQAISAKEDRNRTTTLAGAASPPPQPSRSASSPTTLVGASGPIQEVYKRIGLVAQSDAAVLIRGDTGTGKELVARAIHEHSRRADRPFVPVNCGALPDHLVESELFGYVRGAFTGAEGDKPGRFELADTGTLFLDEVGELPLAAQVKLLRFLDEQIVERLGSVQPMRLDVRILAATNRDLARAIDAGQFRNDLFYRLAVIQIELPPLARRADDVLPLARHFLTLAQQHPGGPPTISRHAAELLTRYNWPGNVRELRNAIQHAAIVSGGSTILPIHLPESIRNFSVARPGDPAGRSASAGPAMTKYLDAILADRSAQTGLYRAAIEPLEQELIRKVLADCDGNQTAAAARLGLHRNTLRNKLREMGLEDSEQ